MKRFFLLDYYDPAINYQGEGIISLDCSASYYLDKNNLKYKILEDYYSEKDLRAEEKDYYFDQLKWFESFDGFLKEHISLCFRFDIPLARANYLRLKYFVDTIVIYSFIISKFIEKEKEIEEVIYVAKPFPEQNGESIFDFKRINRKVFKDLLELFCKKSNIAFSTRIADEKGLRRKESYHAGFGCNPSLKSFLKSIYNFVKYEKVTKLLTLNAAFKNRHVFFMHAGSVDVDYPLKELLVNGAKVYLQEKDKVLREDLFLRKSLDIQEADSGTLKQIEDECVRCSRLLKDDKKIIPWINNKCGLDVSLIVVAFLENFISEDCCCVLQNAEKMLGFYKKNKIDCIFARGNTDRDSLGSIIAAKYMRGAKSVCVQHSNFALNNEVFAVIEMETYDFVLTRDDISHEYYKRALSEIYSCDCKPVQSAHYLRSIREKKKTLKFGKAPTVIYVEKKFPDRVRSFNNMIYPLNWYYKYQKSIVDFFGRETSFDFVYKHSMGQEWARESILKYIEDKGYRNITVREEPFIKLAKHADKVIVDYPSGALFEAAKAGKSVLCVCADYFNIIKEAKDVFGRSLQTFSEIEDAISIIKEFFYANPDDYVVEIPFSDDDFVGIFNQLVE